MTRLNDKELANVIGGFFGIRFPYSPSSHRPVGGYHTTIPFVPVIEKKVEVVIAEEVGTAIGHV